MDFIPLEEAAEQVDDNVCLFRVVSCTSPKRLTGAEYVHWCSEVCPWTGLCIIGDKQTMSVSTLIWA